MAAGFVRGRGARATNYKKKAAELESMMLFSARAKTAATGGSRTAPLHKKGLGREEHRARSHCARLIAIVSRPRLDAGLSEGLRIKRFESQKGKFRLTLNT
jgi:hypothetical protein